MKKVIAFSGSPIKGGNLEKGLHLVLDSTGLSTRFIRLADLNMKVCIACKKCAVTNSCIFNDDINPLLEEIEQADALIFSGFPSYGAINALTKVFIERLWPLRHRKFATKGKVSVSVITSAGQPKELCDYFEHYCTDYLGTNYQGSLAIVGILPCLSCGYGESCQVSGFIGIHGEGKTIKEEHFNNFEDNLEGQKEAKKLGEKIAQALL